MLELETQKAVRKLIDAGVLHEGTLKTLAGMVDLVRGARPARANGAGAASTTGKRRSRATITKEALAAYLKDHTGAEAAAHFGVSTATINNKKQAFGLTKKKAKRKVGKKKGSKRKTGKK